MSYSVRILQEKLNEIIVSNDRSKDKVNEIVLLVEIIRAKSLCDYVGDEDHNFAKIRVALPKYVPAAKRLLNSNADLHPKTKFHNFEFFETNVDVETRYVFLSAFQFMSRGIVGSWSTRKYRVARGSNYRLGNGTSDRPIRPLRSSRRVRSRWTFRLPISSRYLPTVSGRKLHRLKC